MIGGFGGGMSDVDRGQGILYIKEADGLGLVRTPGRSPLGSLDKPGGLCYKIRYVWILDKREVAGRRLTDIGAGPPHRYGG